MQQGRVQLDADWNAQVAIQLRYLRMLATDLIGPHGGPSDGFAITDKAASGGQLTGDFSITQGRYYVGGWPCENDGDVLYRSQSTLRHLPTPAALEADKGYFVYLDVWERHIGTAEADGPIEVDRRYPDLLRELALGGADTSSRAQLVWQVNVTNRLDRGATPIEVPNASGDWEQWANDNIVTRWEEWVDGWKPNRRGSLRVEARKPGDERDGEPCVISPKSQYRGLENQLYRVEIHRPGAAAGREGERHDTDATFKWSRENGSVLLPVESIAANKIKLAIWWRDDRLGITEGDWVEVANDVTALSNAANPLQRVKKVDRDELTLTLDDTPAGVTDEPSLHPVVRRWDHRRPTAGAVGSTEIASDGALYIVEDEWIELESGIRVRFDASPDAAVDHRYLTGDYWTIPARTSVGDVLWPKLPNTGQPQQLEPESLAPHGVEHQFAPLAIITVAGNNEVKMEADLRLTFKPLAAP
jgi:hypothetical protein